ncbi:phosphate/phosphite/phosphonate ABC transporter substrate-binding protein [Marinospirillum sp.]|uniref:phosphate/phosphite/phosphonate ABC transporter substrate-binding protein n=1 Tax=Marinospirillum sp. TaxID=2183934 RepID=UPI0025C31DD5|nr:phosphate/phosphite/phosphonate ABC transporter substrate-binding protein [Marinospirillum sp.]
MLKPAALTKTLMPLLTGAVAMTFSAALLASDLAARFQDRNGDLVADTPTNAREWVDPATLIFAYTPVEDPAVYARVWEGFMKHMEQVTGKNVRFFPVQSNAAQLEAMRAGRLHVAGFNTGSNPLAVNCAGFVPFAMMAREDNSFGYEMEIITYPGSGISSIPDLKGRNLAFTSPTSNSGFKAPSALLEAEFNLLEKRDFEPAFSGGHDNSILGVVNKDYDAAAIANSVLKRMIARGVVRDNQYETIYTSQTFPTTGYGHVYNLKPELAEKVKQAFFTYDWEGSALKAEFQNSGEARFIPITYKEHWAVIRTIDNAMGVKYNCN